jgi:NADH:ubiquinone oxidoreductase subunit E
MDNEMLQEMSAKYQAELAKYQHVIHVCAGTGCVSSNSQMVLAAFDKEIKLRGINDQVLIKQVGCMGLCAAGPIVSVFRMASFTSM